MALHISYLQFFVLLLALDTLIFRFANSSTSGYYGLLSHAYFGHCLGPIAHFLCNTAHHDRHDKQSELGHQTFTTSEIDRARASHLFARGQAKVEGNDTTSSFDRRASSLSITNTAIAYTTVVNVGSPATSYTLLIDTGSSNTWVGARSAYKRTKTSISTGHSVQASYGSGSFSGTECKHLHNLVGCLY